MDSPDSCDTFGYANRRPALFETVKLMDWVFDSFSIQAALDTDLTIAEIPVKYSSDTDTLQLYPNDSMMTLLPSTSDGTRVVLSYWLASIPEIGVTGIWWSIPIGWLIADRKSTRLNSSH